MPSCLFSKSPTSSSAAASAPSPTPPSVSREYDRTVQATSFAEIRSMIQGAPPQGEVRLLRPDGECVHEALGKSKSGGALGRLISAYFDHTETASQLCLRLHRCVQGAGDMYAPLLDLLSFDDSDPLPLTAAHCDRAFDLFLRFDAHDNPFPDSDDGSGGGVRSSLSDLKKQLDFRLGKSRRRIRLLRRAAAGSALCFVATAVGVAAAAVGVAIHATLALAVAAAPVCSGACMPNASCAAERREIAKLAQFDAAAKGAYVLSYDLDTIDRLVARLHTAVESDKLLVRLGLERGRVSYPIQEVLRLLCKNRRSFLRQLEDLEEHICLCIYTVNKARLLLLQEIRNHQTL